MCLKIGQLFVQIEAIKNVIRCKLIICSAEENDSKLPEHSFHTVEASCLPGGASIPPWIVKHLPLEWSKTYRNKWYSSFNHLFITNFKFKAKTRSSYDFLCHSKPVLPQNKYLSDVIKPRSKQYSFLLIIGVILTQATIMFTPVKINDVIWVTIFLSFCS